MARLRLSFAITVAAVAALAASGGVALATRSNT
jgi:hypothetical protein